MLSFMKGRKSTGPQNGSSPAPSPAKPGSAGTGAVVQAKDMCPLARMLLNDLEGLRTDSSRKFAKLREASSEATRFHLHPLLLSMSLSQANLNRFPIRISDSSRSLLGLDLQLPIVFLRTS